MTKKTAEEIATTINDFGKELRENYRMGGDELNQLLLAVISNLDVDGIGLIASLGPHCVLKLYEGTLND